MPNKIHLLLIAIGFLLTSIDSGVYLYHTEVGRSYPGWKEGEIDIHHIYTGRGESNFYILPDGTSMLIDAGDWDPTSEEYPLMTALLPDSSRRAGEWIARYILRVNPHTDHVDYLMVSHFHSDHIGDGRKGERQTEGRTPNYLLSGVAQVAEYIRFDKVIDRAYPDYNFPRPLDSDIDFANYRKFIAWKVKSGQLQAERFEVGRRDQVALQKSRGRYPTFQIRNVVGNGVIWTGRGDETDSLYRTDNQNLSVGYNGNTMSTGLLISYGPFRYFTAGDLSGRVYDEQGNDLGIEERVAQVCGPVDVCKANHHGYKDAMTDGVVRNMQADAYVVSVWDFEHIQPDVIERMTDERHHSDKSRVYFSRFPEVLRDKYNNEEWMRRIAEKDGHVVIKVLADGIRYKVYVLSARDERQEVLAVYGPFFSRGQAN